MKTEDEQGEAGVDVRVQSPQTGESHTVALDEDMTIGALSRVVQGLREDDSSLLIYGYCSRDFAEGLADRARVDGDEVYFPEDMLAVEALAGLRDSRLPFYFNVGALSDELVFEFRTDRLRRVGYGTDVLQTKRVVLGGAGLLGNEVAWGLCVCGVGELLVLDSGRVDWYNIYRQQLFGRESVYENKAVALGQALAKVGGIECEAEQREVPCLASPPDRAWFGERIATLWRQIERADLVIGAFDIFSARGVLQVLARVLNKTFVSSSLDAAIGEVGVFRPDEQVCYCCGHWPGQFADGGACTLAQFSAQRIVGAVTTECVLAELMGRGAKYNFVSFAGAYMHMESGRRRGARGCVVCGPDSTLGGVQDADAAADWIYAWLFGEPEAS
ncbi:ThiF family adenylyltransferase [Pseudenhygromyxa sp. WMMC2535]|uniref:HesA/MoeB/ThiF family protein n=1 Tax=Pseudenhygromyxa sp. WMMC2535 TaxID=2712867 RepID=UPI0015572171|nr:ThiF family adenylyltransferase [Pseudenhygromyxa sp. WMMC2535]NVB39841.1 ThiF family adenylyltransferase [Pseudenhygromyxa sp. WMMC2535]